MRMLALSDSHGDTDGLRRMLLHVWTLVGPIDAYIHLGDGARDFEHIEPMIWERDPRAARYGVAGNCDLACDLPERLLVQVGGHKLFLCHGHRYHVKDSYLPLAYAAQEAGCEAALFGHTHVPAEERGSVLLVNPGSVRDGRCALITEDAGGALQVNLMRM